MINVNAATEIRAHFKQNGPNNFTVRGPEYVLLPVLPRPLSLRIRH